MSEFSNPLLLDPGATTQDRVEPLRAMTAPFPVRKAEETRYYVCTLPNHHMHRTDGKRLTFIHSIYATDELNDIEYLDAEVRAGNPYMRLPTEQEIHTHKMRTDPRGTIANELTPQIEATIRARLEAELEASMAAKLNSLNLTEEQKATLAGMQDQADNSEANLAGSSALERLRSMQANGIKTNGGTLLGIAGTDKMAGANSPTPEEAKVQGN
jgi:hypothetical protein